MSIPKAGTNDLVELNGPADPLPVLAAEELEPSFRAVVGRDGERRGIRLERIYWNGLNRMSAAGRVTMADIVQYTAKQLPDSGNLASSLRVMSLKWALHRLDALDDASSLANLNALIQASPSPTVLLTREKKIQHFNDAFLGMLRHRFPMGDAPQLIKTLRFSIDTQIEDALETLNLNSGKTLNTGFSIAIGSQLLKGQINLALAPMHRVSMLIGYIAKY
ncbi:ribbon-helix-helix domain-containing protein [Rhizobium sp. RAF56]|jgi:predicted DNA-binding ribbon-helix-helix protein|uniref:ribbon-helix-helix domain-containing protein n=1 Tax=Rhizobium sp. RAF56 TaxID=3233062 RepID=UPI003F945F51